jgi:hypothetical protein
MLTDPLAPNRRWAYGCRSCNSDLFMVAWYTAPRSRSGDPRPPGWAIECASCGRATLMPDAPEMSEARRLPVSIIEEGTGDA